MIRKQSTPYAWKIHGRLICVLAVILTSPGILAQGMDWKLRGEQGGVTVRLAPRTPEQMAAFYEGRGFPKAATEAVKEACFITVGVENRTNSILWLELDRWRLMASEGEVRRLNRSDWKAQWDALELPAPNRATFRWTLLPESRDLWSEEPVGGNITLVPPAGPFTLEARFVLGQNKDQGERSIKIEGVQCAQDERQ